MVIPLGTVSGAALRDHISNGLLKHFSVQGNAPVEKAQNDQTVTSVRMSLKTGFVLNKSPCWIG
jgi:hypothetical protein